MDFKPNDAEQMIRDMARQFAAEYIEPRVKEIEEKDEFFPDLVQKMGEQGLLPWRCPRSSVARSAAPWPP